MRSSSPEGLVPPGIPVMSAQGDCEFLVQRARELVQHDLWAAKSWLITARSLYPADFNIQVGQGHAGAGGVAVAALAARCAPPPGHPREAGARRPPGGSGGGGGAGACGPAARPGPEAGAVRSLVHPDGGRLFPHLRRCSSSPGSPGALSEPGAQSSRMSRCSHAGRPRGWGGARRAVVTGLTCVAV